MANFARALSLSLAFLLVWAPLAWGQWDSSSDGIHYDEGNVGIGVTNPAAPVHLESNGTIGGWNGSLNDAWFRVGYRYMDPNEIYVDGAAFHIGTWSSNQLRFGTNGRRRLWIKSNGHVRVGRNLGVGTASPDTRLHLQSKTKDAIALIESDPGNEDESHNPILRLQQDGGWVRTDLGHEGGSGETHRNTLTNAFYLTTRNDGANRPLQIGTKGQMHLTMRSDGDVGLGTTSPNEELSVAGNVLAEEVIVKPRDQWSDYVFEESYDLPTLAEVSTFIDEEGHLPSVPSAEEVETNGLRLGQMDATLLRKVEELTLYAIEQKKRADRQAARNQRQAAQIDSLRAENETLRRRLRQQARAHQRQQKQLRRQQRQIQRLMETVQEQE